MIITKRSLPRRTFLRGMGCTLALPFLDAMVPALTAQRLTAANPVRRLGAIYLPNGISMEKWTPAVEGAAFEFSPTLSPVAPFRDRLLVLSGMSNRAADTFPGEGGGDHARGQAAFLTGVHAKKMQARAELGISMDQIAAKELGRHTQLSSLELALESSDLVGGCETGLSCAYIGTIAWRSATTPLPMETDPRAAFERLFGASDSTDAGARQARVQKDRSILDAITQELTRIQSGLGSGDRGKLTEYVDAVRDVERRIQKAEDQTDQELPAVDQPAGIPVSFEEYTKLMYDMIALAYQSDMTRVCTFMIGREQSNRTFPEVGVPEPWHPMSHHNYSPALLAKQAKVDVFNVKLFAHFLQKLASTPDGDGSLLDHSLIIYGAGLSDSNIHLHHDLPILLAGGGSGQVKGGRHLRFAKDTPLTNLHMTVLDKMGIHAETLGDSTGKVELLSDV